MQSKISNQMAVYERNGVVKNARGTGKGIWVIHGEEEKVLVEEY